MFKLWKFLVCFHYILLVGFSYEIKKKIALALSSSASLFT